MELDDQKRWWYTEEGEGGKIVVKGRVVDFCLDLGGVLKGVG